MVKLFVLVLLDQVPFDFLILSDIKLVRPHIQFEWPLDYTFPHAFISQDVGGK